MPAINSIPIQCPGTARSDGGFPAGFPNVIGAIDCTHVAIRAPHVNEYMYVNRKNFHSINVQLICDARMAILNAVARWPGSTHDSFIVRNCSVGNRLEAGAGRDGWLLGRPRIRPYHGWKMRLRVGGVHDGLEMKRLVVAEALIVREMGPLVRRLQVQLVPGRQSDCSVQLVFV
ncbi:hypothetical protein ACEWY4_004059 [Coilia grayii]|uniref:DDE Tnp4 domain-containing protein n=1 Tax=Coilia grayii TaxID=363190 RepID=A0ABD1KKM4_9TELE